MRPVDHPPAAAAPDETEAMRPAAYRTVLDPVSRASEILFGLIMVLTFTLSLAATEAGRADVRAVLIGMVGCNLAWAIIDAVMYLMGARGERQLSISTVRALREAETPAVGRAIVAGNLPPAVLPALTTSDLERIRLYLASLPPESLETRFGREDYLCRPWRLPARLSVPVPGRRAVPPDRRCRLALRLSNAVAIGMLFLTGFTFGRQVGSPWRTGLLMVIIGIALVAVAMALGG